MSTVMMEAVMNVDEMIDLCTSRWGIELLITDEARERMCELAVLPETVLLGIDDLLTVSGYGGRVLEIDVRAFEDGPIPAAAVSMSWV